MDDIYISKQPNRNNGINNGHPEPPFKKKRSKAGSVFIALILILLLCAGCAFAYFYSLLGNIKHNENGHRENVYVNQNELLFDKKVTNILILGIDARAEEEVSRSDTMLMLSIDRKNKKIKLTSFLRDMWVDIPDSGYAKLNAACTYGGAQLVMDTLEYNFNVKIDNYVLVDFDFFTTLIDKLGGIELDITEYESKWLNKEYGFKTTSGINSDVNGEVALMYCRIRYLDSDFKRTERQRKTMLSIMSTVKTKPYTELLDIVEELLPRVETDFTRNDLMKLGFGALLSYMRYDIKQAQIPQDGAWSNKYIKGQSVLAVDFDKNKTILENYLYGVDVDETTTEATQTK